MERKGGRLRAGRPLHTARQLRDPADRSKRLRNTLTTPPDALANNSDWVDL